ncbi:MAG: LLM class flavin-dependent oxidoreductase [Acidimicrobiia bacterium]
MELGLFVEPQCGGSYERLIELARWAEATGFAAFARSDHYLDGEDSNDATDALVSFGGLARETSKIRLVSLVSPITFRHPAVLAKSAATIDEMSGGRFTLGVGAGWMRSEHEAFGVDLPPIEERFDRLEEALAVIAAITSGGGSVPGTHHSLDITRVHPRVSDGFAIVIGGAGRRRTPQLAGRYADEYNLFVTERHNLDERVETMRTAAVAASRDPDAILVSFAGPVLIHESEREHAEALETRGARRGISATDYRDLLDARGVPHGTPEMARAVIDRLMSWGIGRYYIQEYRPLDAIDLDRMRLVFEAIGT